MKPGDRFECEVESAAFGGDGVARVAGMVAFIPFALPGEKLTARIVKVKSDYLRAEIVSIGQASPFRIEPECPLYRRCPGCAYLHCAYECELELKLAQLRSMLRVAGLDLAAEAAAGNRALPNEFYRNKIVLHARKDAGRTELGYVGRNPSELVDVERCLLASPGINAELAACRAKPGFFNSLHDGMDVTFRESAAGVAMWRNSPPRNLSWLRENMPFGSFSVPAGSFSQVNPDGAAQLIGLLRDYLSRRPAASVADIYGGAGLFGLTAGLAGASEVIVIESDPAAVAAAEYNFRNYGVRGGFLAGDAAELLPETLERVELAIVDPPRTGLPGRAIGALASGRADRLVYISCNPATFMRDAGKLSAAGFQAAEIRMVNMFPRSAGFELFSVWER